MLQWLCAVPRNSPGPYRPSWRASQAMLRARAWPTVPRGSSSPLNKQDAGSWSPLDKKRH